MLERRCNLTVWILSFVILFLILIIGKLFFDFAKLDLRVALAYEQIDIFDDMNNKARNSDIPEAVDCLAYVAHYYPSGTKQVKGSQLDHIVESARRNTIQDIIAILRKKSGKDYGEDPEQWITNLRKPRSKPDNKP